MSTLQTVLLTPFVMAALAPWAVNRWRKPAVLLFAAVSAGLTALLLAQIPAVLAGQAPGFSVAWLPEFSLNYALRLDAFSLMVAATVTGVGAIVLHFASVYFAEHAAPGRFYLYLLSFMGSMLGIVLAENLFLLFIFWELTSVTSFMLIGYDHHRNESREAALRALLLTGAGGLALLAGIALLLGAAGTLSLDELRAAGGLDRDHALYPAIVVLFLLGAFTKSAQFPFHFWLPGAMEAPSPVSAYLHSATMVKAGVFLLAIMSPILGGTPLWNTTLLTVGMTTMVVGAAMGFVQSDMKRMLAYTTVSVLGVLVALIGAGTPDAFLALTVFWLAHVFYKATLFLLTGAVDHEFGSRDLRRLGALRGSAPWLALAGALCALSMWGFPPLLGFLGKELLYEAVLHADIPEPFKLPVSTSLVFFAMVLMGAAGLLAGIKPFFGPKPKPAGADPDEHDAGDHHGHGSHATEFALGPLVLAFAGLAAGLLAGLISPFMTLASGAAFGAPVEGKLALWHGFTPALALSIPTLAVAVVLALAWAYVQPPLLRILEALSRIGPLRAYDAAWYTIKGIAWLEVRALTRIFLRHEVMMVLAGIPLFIGFSLWTHPIDLPEEFNLSPVGTHEVVLGAMVLISATVAVHARSLPGAIAGLGVVGYGVALIFARFGGPDLAMTQFAVETLTVILFVLVIYRLPKPIRYTGWLDRGASAILAGTFGASMALLTFFTSVGRAPSRMSPDFVARSVPEAKGHNIVNVILVDFRALDTLGEITVLAAAALGIFALMKLWPGRDAAQ